MAPDRVGLESQVTLAFLRRPGRLRTGNEFPSGGPPPGWGASIVSVTVSILFRIAGAPFPARPFFLAEILAATEVSPLTSPFPWARSLASRIRRFV